MQVSLCARIDIEVFHQGMGGGSHAVARIEDLPQFGQQENSDPGNPGGCLSVWSQQDPDNQQDIDENDRVEKSPVRNECGFIKDL